MQGFRPERGIAPPLHSQKGKYGWGRFEVGDSAFYAGDFRTISPAAYNYARRNNVTFVVRKAMEDGHDGVRVWRTA